MQITVCDTNTSEQIQETINGSTDGDIVAFSPGSYRITSTITLLPGRYYEGYGARLGGASPVFHVRSSPLSFWERLRKFFHLPIKTVGCSIVGFCFSPPEV